MEKIKPDFDKARKELGLDLIVSKDVVISGGEDVTEEIKNYFNNLERD
jgi:hypothetical protein